MSQFTRLTSMEEIDTFIADHPLAFLYVSREGCSVCHGLLPQVEEIMERYPNISCAHIDADEVAAVAGRFSIFAVPVLLLFVEGKEYIREARIVHMDLFEEKVEKVYQHMN